LEKYGIKRQEVKALVFRYVFAYYNRLQVYTASRLRFALKWSINALHDLFGLYFWVFSHCTFLDGSSFHAVQSPNNDIFI
jgi:hypothetical protein